MMIYREYAVMSPFYGIKFKFNTARQARRYLERYNAAAKLYIERRTLIKNHGIIETRIVYPQLGNVISHERAHYLYVIDGSLQPGARYAHKTRSRAYAALKSGSIYLINTRTKRSEKIGGRNE